MSLTLPLSFPSLVLSSVISWCVRGIFSILSGGKLLSLPFVSLTLPLSFPSVSFSKCFFIYIYLNIFHAELLTSSPL